ncbi:exosortase/archaeosortase family protein [Planctomycetota bacterium]
MPEARKEPARPQGPQPTLRALATIVLAGSLIFTCTVIPKSCLDGIDETTTDVLSGLLNAMGLDAFSTGNKLTCQDASLIIGFGCNGLLASGILASAILAFAAKPTAKLVGLILGVILVLAVNQLRLIGLTFLAMYASAEHFEFMHVAIGQIVMLLVIFLYWNSWASRVVAAARPAIQQTGHDPDEPK